MLSKPLSHPAGSRGRRRVGVYLESSKGGELGGAQTHAAVLVEALARHHQVELLVRAPDFSLQRLAAASATDLSGVSLRYSPELNETHHPRRVTAAYDLFVCFAHDIHPHCPAPNGVLMVLFPYYDKQHLWPWSDGGKGNPVKRVVRDMLAERDWRRRFSGYSTCTANSDFTRRWTRQRWGVDAHTVSPPVAMDDGMLAKESLILSVGRFATSGLNKHQRELLESYELLKRSLPVGASASYVTAGACGDDPASLAFLEDCRAVGRRCGAQVVANAQSASLQDFYRKATVFWHAAGLGHDEDRTPELAEHFGMSTVEAMARGCVPVVIAKGGQTEIVRHGENGFLCRDLTEMRSFTQHLLVDAELRDRLAASARRDAKQFTRERFVRRMAELLPAWLPSDRSAVQSLSR